jgi:uncharacterized damage-inducible protein DinB
MRRIDTLLDSFIQAFRHCDKTRDFEMRETRLIASLIHCLIDSFFHSFILSFFHFPLIRGMNRFKTCCTKFVLGLFAWCVCGAMIDKSDNNQPINMNASNNVQIEHFNKIAAYNTWANQQLVDWLLLADSNQWNKNIESSFNTLELTTRHLWNAEHGWLATLKKQPWSMAVEAEKKLLKNEILNGFIKTSIEFQEFVSSIKESDLNDTRIVGKAEKKMLVSDIIQHVFNHATYHRGQLITMGRQVGLANPPRTDYIYFMMLQ